MTYYSAEHMKQLLDANPKYQEYLYCRGFLLSDKSFDDANGYPFYGNWREETIGTWPIRLFCYIHKDNNLHTLQAGDFTLFLIGHAYNPYSMLYEEQPILQRLAKALETSEDDYWKEESNVTGVFATGFVDAKDQRVVLSTDAAGMQLVNIGVVNKTFYATSHCKIVGDKEQLVQDPYITKLINDRFYHFFGEWLPGDLTSYLELKRAQPNFAYEFSFSTKELSFRRYYPMATIKEATSQEETNAIIDELAKTMTNTMNLVAKKWPNKQAAISVTGGRDSMTALACAHESYDRFGYFSYISNYDESVDADAAHTILGHLGLEHKIIPIPDEFEGYKDLELFRKILECNAGCIGHNNENDVKKRLYFCEHPPCKMEVKSWVSETGRCYNHDRFNKKSFPDYPSPSYLRCMHKVYVDSIGLIRKTDRVFQDYLNKYFSKDLVGKVSWVELLFWEFSWSGLEGVSLTTEHRVSYDITIPFNNRRYMETMLRIPLEIRRVDGVPIAVTAKAEPRIAETGVAVKDVSHTVLRSYAERAYLEIFSKLSFARWDPE